MSDSRNPILRKAELIMQCRQQRAELAAEWRHMRTTTTPAGMTASVLEAVRRHKLLVLASAAAFAFVKPRRVVAGLEAGLLGWEVWRSAVPLFQRIWGHFHKGESARDKSEA